VPTNHRSPHIQVAWLLQKASLNPTTLPTTAWAWLEAAHIVGQTHFVSHARVHFHMLKRAFFERNALEFFAQLLRLSLVPMGHLLQRLPTGNPGSGRVSAFKPMRVPQHLAVLIEQCNAVNLPQTK
jgi:Protein of unknown function (DUF3703)